MMIRALGASLVLAVALHVVVGAQQVSEGRNVMPVWMPCDPANVQCQTDPRWDSAWKYGDIFLQRQVECSLAPSLVNSNHLLAGCIDYSAVDAVTGDNPPTFGSTGLGRFVGLLARLVRRPREPAPLPKGYASGGEAWIRGIWTTNGFATSTPFFVPGAPWGTSSVDTSTFYSGIANGTSDPIVVSAPNGDFHMIYMAFHRATNGTIDVNYMVDWPLVDKNVPDEPTRHSLASKSAPSMIAGGQNGSFGNFHDKPHAIVVANASSPAGYDLYVSYTLFTGTGTATASHVYVAKTSNGGGSWTIEKVSQSTNGVSGTVMVPTSGGVSIFYRSFGTSPTIYYSRRQSSGWTKPVSILDKTYPTLMAFDQASVKVDSTSATSVQGSEGNITPRSNAFPTAALATNGTVFVAWHECADPATGLPKSCAFGGSPRIMLTSLPSGQSTFTPRKAVDIGIRSAEANGFGYFWNVGRDNNSAHPQIMPSLSCTVPTGTNSGCLLTYWESRTATLTTAGGVPGIGGYHRLVDLRGALLNANGTVAKSFQISRYPYRPNTNLADPTSPTGLRQETVNDVDRVNETIASDGTKQCVGPPSETFPGLDDPNCIPRLNYYCRNQTAGGTICFDGDYNGLVANAPLVFKNGIWQVPTSPQDVPGVGWHAMSATNQNLLPPRAPLPSQGGIPPADQLTRYTAWTPGHNGLPACEAGGSRNTDSYVFDVNLGLLVTAPVTAKTTASPGEAPFISFPVTAWNGSNQAKTVTFTIDTPNSQSVTASFSKTNPTNKTGSSVINAFSSTTHVVYVQYPLSTTIVPVHVSVSDGASTSGVTFNPAGAAQPSVGSLTSTLSVSDPIIAGPSNAGPSNAGPSNVAAQNLSYSTAGPSNAGPSNAGPSNSSPVEPTSWIVQVSGDATKPYSATPQIDQTVLAAYDFRMLIYRLTSIGACVDASGNTAIQYQPTLVANAGPSNAGPSNAGPSNAGPSNIALGDGFTTDNFTTNSVFTPKPANNTQSGTQNAASIQSNECRVGECVDAQPPETELTVIQLFADRKPNTDGLPTFDPRTAPVSLTVADYWCLDPNNSAQCTIVQKGPDLVVGTAPGVSPNPVRAGQSVQFPMGGYPVLNNGNLPAGPRRYGFYLSNDDKLDQTQDLLLGSVSFSNQLQVGGSDTVPQQALTIPLSTPPGTRYLFLYADDLRTVSETNEKNNGQLVPIPITVLPPRYQLIGLFTPCSGLTCGTRNGGSSTPIAFQLSFDGSTAVDSFSTKPRLRFYDSTGTLLFSADSTDLSSGSSLWQYFGASCAPVGSTTCSRPAFTWQYNWQTKNPVTGANLPAGNYVIKVEVVSTNQFDGTAPDGTVGDGAIASITITVK